MGKPLFKDLAVKQKLKVHYYTQEQLIVEFSALYGRVNDLFLHKSLVSQEEY